MIRHQTNMVVFNAAMAAAIRDCLAGHAYNPGVEPVEDNDDILDGYQAGWHAAHQEWIAHQIDVKKDGGHGYPFRARCACGWQSNTYAAAHAAWDMADDHVEDQAMRWIDRTAE